MFWINLQRIIKSGFLNFWRNRFVSLASVLVMIITLFVIGGTIFSSIALTTALEQIQKRVDINVYFLPDAEEEDVLGLKRSIEALPEVASVEYINREQVLEEFIERHRGDEITLQTLDEIGLNPFGSVLNIRAKETSQYEGIAVFLEGDGVLSRNGNDIIDNVNYAQNKQVIDRLSSIINTADRFGLLIVLVFVIMSIIITFNTIRLAIFISREEISVMRLVGASNSYVRGPFVVTGVIYGVISAIITLIIWYPVTYWLGPKGVGSFVGLDIFAYYVDNFGQIFFVMMGSGIILGAISSYLAVRRYLQS